MPEVVALFDSPNKHVAAAAIQAAAAHRERSAKLLLAGSSAPSPRTRLTCTALFGRLYRGRHVVELMLRAVRDHWADCRETLPFLLEREDTASIHFYLGGLTGMRKALFPGLETAYEAWRQADDWSPLTRCVEEGEAHWASLARQLSDYEVLPARQAQSEIKELVEANVFY